MLFYAWWFLITKKENIYENDNGYSALKRKKENKRNNKLRYSITYYYTTHNSFL